MENCLGPNLEEQTSVDAPDPERIEISPQQHERLRLEGCEVIASGIVQFPEGKTVAIIPFPKSKTGFTVEIHLAPAQTSNAKPTYKDFRDEATRTYRHQFFGYDAAFTMQPFGVAIYRGKIVMGILAASIILHRPRLWSLTYTLYYAPKPPRRVKAPAA